MRINIGVESRYCGVGVDNVEGIFCVDIITSRSRYSKVVHMSDCMDRKVSCEQQTKKDDLGRYLRSCSTATNSPGARIVYAPRAAAVLGTYFSLIPVNEG